MTFRVVQPSCVLADQYPSDSASFRRKGEPSSTEKKTEPLSPDRERKPPTPTDKETAPPRHPATAGFNFLSRKKPANERNFRACLVGKAERVGGDLPTPSQPSPAHRQTQTHTPHAYGKSFRGPVEGGSADHKTSLRRLHSARSRPGLCMFRVPLRRTNR